MLVAKIAKIVDIKEFIFLFLCKYLLFYTFLTIFMKNKHHFECIIKRKYGYPNRRTN